MIWWKNIPFLLIWSPLLLSSISAALPSRFSRKLMGIVPAAGMIFSAFLLFKLGATDGESYLYSLGAFGAPVGNELRIGPLEALLAAVFCMILVCSVVGGYARMKTHVAERRQNLYAVMVMLLMSSLMAEIFTNDVFTGYVFLEIMTISACALVLARTEGKTLFAAAKYMIMNLLGSGLFLMGISILYSLTGHLLMSDIHERVVVMMEDGQYMRPMALSLGMITIGLSIKAALYPFHTWLPNAYASATPSSSAMLSSLISKAYIFLYIKFVVRVYGFEAFRATGIQNILLLYSLFGIILGSVDAILEKKLCRMIAYSSVAQIGYIYLGIAIGTPAGIAAAVFHILSHAIAKSMLFLSGDRLVQVSGDNEGFHRLRGSGFRAPLAGVCFTVGACSIVGIPMLAGFSSKVFLAEACIGLGSWKAIIALSVLAVSTLLNAVYFLVTVITIYSNPVTDYAEKPKASLLNAGAIAMMSLTILLMGFFASAIMQIITHGVAAMM